ncbi:Uma2 family endonuclease [Methylomarinum sp. Ch1-1]|uniref:Uma2 family endonuclease n=1 Tax=Methylomarinum roseum TaxID=3067653 RepID=A0AAU7NSS1_9GAMM|nr:Uma2 family endonuclease [Methylomarinum sp. Ch1-1]MDP4520316.1 Uma2 family endonuclease [Methylomarinum sp. Ch1-1]
MALQPSHRRISAEDYLQYELSTDVKHQLVDGEIFAMGGASENHNLLAGNIFSEFKNRLKGCPCRTFMADMKLRVAEDFFYPDVMVVCQEDKENDYYKTSPTVVVEVLSKSTRKFDQTQKRLRCQQLPTLEEYVLVEQDKGEIQVFSRKDGWQSFYYYLGDQITFNSLNITVPVEAIYDQVDIEDVTMFHEQNQE